MQTVVKGMVQVAGSTYRIVRVGRGQHEIACVPLHGAETRVGRVGLA